MNSVGLDCVPCAMPMSCTCLLNCDSKFPHKILPLLLSTFICNSFIARNANEYRICTPWIAHKQSYIWTWKCGGTLCESSFCFHSSSAASFEFERNFFLLLASRMKIIIKETRRQRKLSTASALCAWVAYVFSVTRQRIFQHAAEIRNSVRNSDEFRKDYFYISIS